MDSGPATASNSCVTRARVPEMSQKCRKTSLPNSKTTCTALRQPTTGQLLPLAGCRKVVLSSVGLGHYTNSQKELQVIQNKVVRFTIHSIHKDSRTHIVQRELNSLNIPKVSDRVGQRKLNHIHKAFYDTTPRYMHNFLVKTSDLPNYNTRSSSLKPPGLRE